jgi:hypothetical protein
MALGAAAVGVDVDHSNRHACLSCRPELLDWALSRRTGASLSVDPMPAFAFQQCSGYLGRGDDNLAWLCRRPRGPP